MPLAHLAEVLTEAAPVAERFAGAGHRTYLVGGIVRDLWLDAELDPDTDLDLTTDAHPEQIKAVLADVADAMWTQGERFGTIGAMIAGRAWEITTHRSERYDPTSRKPAVSYADRLDADLSRRDFTVNAMAIALPDGELVDPFGGALDLEHHRLRTPLRPVESFGDDPLRILRAARFAATHSLVPDAEVIEAIASMASRLAIVAAERIRLELDKLLCAPDPGPGLDLLRDTGVLERLLPEVHQVTDADWNRWLDRVPEVPAALEARLAAVLVLVPAPVRIARMRALRQPGAITRAAVGMASVAEELLSGALRTDSDLRRSRAGNPPDRWAAAFELALTLADSTMRSQLEELAARRDALAEDLDRIGGPDELPLDGAAVMEVLGLAPGEIVGEALEVLRDHRHEHGPIDPEAARAVLEAWWNGRRSGEPGRSGG